MEKYGTALILGYGRSGRAAERLLQLEGCRTTVLTEETAGEDELRQALARNRFDVCVVSPGFGVSHAWLEAVRQTGVPIMPEIELGWSRHRGKTVAVTGSNGKSTTVKWIFEMLQTAGKKTAIGGNYGIPACESVVDHPDIEWLVLEVSSFQLETVRQFRADAAVVLNVLPNHLDRHETMETYLRTKARIFESSRPPGDACIIPFGLLASFQGVGKVDRNWITFGPEPAADYVYREGKIFRHSESIADLSGTLFESPVLGGCTGAAVAAVADVCGIGFPAAEQAARCFAPLPHRLQKVAKYEGVTYIDDSKATNLAAMKAAIEFCGENIHLIAGGLSKESDYTFVKEILAERVRRIYVIGQASRAMYRAWNEICPCVECGSLENAFSAAQNAAGAGDTILLSPGCASFDQFDSFEERGERFAVLVSKAVQAGGDAS